MTHSPKLISKRKKKKNRERRELEKRSDLLSTPREKERSEGTGHGVDVYGARRSARSSSDEGQGAVTGSRGQREGGLRSENLRMKCGFRSNDFSDLLF